MVTPAPTSHAASPHALAPHHVLVHLGGSVTDTLLFAMVEGEARLIDAALTLPEGPDRGVAAGIARLAVRSGFPLQPDVAAIDGVILDTRPVSLLLIGERADDDADALSTVRGLGVVRYFHIPAMPPPHPERNPGWVNTVLAAWRFGTIDAVLVDVPDGPAPIWVAQLFNGMAATDDRPPLLVIASDTRIAAVAPSAARILTRGSQLPDQLASALAETQCQRLLPTCARPPTSIFRRQALVTAIIAAQRATATTLWYLDVADGMTLIGADAARAEVSYEPHMDCAAGAPALLSTTRREEMERWLPISTDVADARRWALRRAAWPAAILTDASDRAMAGAFARVLLERFAGAKSLANADAMILGPGWLRWATPVEMLAVVSDVLAPAKPVHLALDPDDVLAATGLLAHLRPESAESTFATDALRPIGTIVAAPARQQRNPLPLAVTLTVADRAVRSVVAPESTARIPVTEPGTLELAYPGMSPEVHEILASECGLLIDTRRRPLVAPRLPAPRGTVSDRLRAAS